MEQKLDMHMFRATWLFAIFNGENTTIPTSAKNV
jgi:hypothetical protein